MTRKVNAPKSSYCRANFSENRRRVMADIVRSVPADDVPHIYVRAAKITDAEGTIRVLEGEELQRFLRWPNAEEGDDVRVIINHDHMMRDMFEESARIYEEVYLRLPPP